MADYVYTRDAQGDLAIRAVSATGVSASNSNDVYTRDTSGNLAIRVVGAGGSGTSDYNALSNKPQINGVTLSGNRLLQEPLTAGDNIIIENNVISAINKTYLPFPDDFVTDDTFEAFVESLAHYSGKSDGSAYLGSISGDWMPWGYGNAECKVEYISVGDDDALATITVSSADIPPYRWEYNTYSGDFTWKYSVLQSKNVPEISEESEGVVFQYIGETDGTYTQGYFYIAVKTGPYTYEWQQINVQPGDNTAVQIAVEGTSTVEGYVVPNPTAEEVTAIYNSVVAGNNVQIVDSNDVYYQVLQSDSIDGAINVEMMYFGEMALLYTLENDTVSITAKKFGGEGGDSKVVITLTGESGTLTEAQIAQVLDDTIVLEIDCDGQIFRLSNKEEDLGYRTFINSDCAIESNMAFKAIYIRVDDSITRGNWTLETVSAGSGAVDSVNSKTGAVVLDADDVNAIPTDGGTLSGELTVSDGENDCGYILGEDGGLTIDSNGDLYIGCTTGQGIIEGPFEVNGNLSKSSSSSDWDDIDDNTYVSKAEVDLVLGDLETLINAL